MSKSKKKKPKRNQKEEGERSKKNQGKTRGKGGKGTKRERSESPKPVIAVPTHNNVPSRTRKRLKQIFQLNHEVATFLPLIEKAKREFNEQPNPNTFNNLSDLNLSLIFKTNETRSEIPPNLRDTNLDQIVSDLDQLKEERDELEKKYDFLNYENLE